MGSFFSLFKNPDEDQRSKLLEIVSLLDTKLGFDVTNIVLEFLGLGHIDFVFEDEFRRLMPHMHFREIVCVYYTIHDTCIEFHGRVDQDDFFRDCCITWRKDSTQSTIKTFSVHCPTVVSKSERRMKLRECYLSQQHLANTRLSKNTTLTVTTVEANKHYIIHDTNDRGSNIRNALSSKRICVF